jgi:hypothetical protein
MDENTLSQPKRQSVAEYKAAIAEMLMEMYRLNEKMQNDQVEIDRLNVETAALKAETRALLARIGAPP